MARVVLCIVALGVVVATAASASAADDNGYIGVQIKKGETGIEVLALIGEGPAEKAGLKLNDVIRKVDGKDVDDLAGFVTMIRDAKPGTKITLAVHRDGKDIEIKVTIEKRPDS